MSFYKQQLKDYLAGLPLPAGKILSIGAQHDDRKYFMAANQVSEFKTLDVDTQFDPDIIWNMSRPIMDIDGDGQNYHWDNYFDTVFAFELWEYIYDPVTAHNNVYQLLKQGGQYWGSYPFVYGKHNPPGTDYLRYTDDGIRKLLSVAGFTDIEIIPRITLMNGSLTEFYQLEEMRIRGDVSQEHVGYIVKARK